MTPDELATMEQLREDLAHLDGIRQRRAAALMLVPSETLAALDRVMMAARCLLSAHDQEVAGCR